MLKPILMSIALLMSFPALGRTVKVNKERSVSINGPIFRNGIYIAQKIERLADGSKEPIHIIIKSPGGSAVTGSQILSAINLAKSRGHEVICYVPMLAASMGFQVFIHCDKR